MYVHLIEMKPGNASVFDWDKYNIGHIARHRIRAEEVEQVLLNAPIHIGEEVHKGEERFLNIGHTETGRVILVWWTFRDDRMRPVTAWPASRQEREEYYAQKGTET